MSYFRLATSGARRGLVDPLGRPFFSLGVVHTGAYIEGEGQAFFTEKYGGDWARLAGKIAADLRGWNFNTAGYHSPPGLIDHLPSMLDCYPAPVAAWMGAPAFPDVFDPAWQTEVADLLERTCAPLREHANLVGVYWTDTPRWDLQRARAQVGTDWVSAIRALPPAAPGKRAYVDFLIESLEGGGERRGSVEEGAPTLERGSENVTERAQGRGERRRNVEEDGPTLERETQNVRGRGSESAAPVYRAALDGAALTREALLAAPLAGLDITHPIVAAHDQAFLGRIAGQYYRTAHMATRKADPNHLIFGDRYLTGDHPPQVLAAALPYIDVLSIQPYGLTFDRAAFDRFHAQTGKPILICDHAINFPTADYPDTLWPQAADEAAAAQAYHDYLLAAAACPYITGYHRCQYIDRVIPGTRLLKQGLLRADETPYPGITAQVRETNQGVLAGYQNR